MDFISSDEKYIKYDISDMKAPILRLEDFYHEAGILNLIEAIVQQFGVEKKDVICLPQQVLVNPKTGKKLESIIEETWEWYNVNRHDGVWKKGGPKKYKTKHPLSHYDKNTLSMHFLNLTPETSEEVPEGECWIRREMKVLKGARQ